MESSPKPARSRCGQPCSSSFTACGGDQSTRSRPLPHAEMKGTEDVLVAEWKKLSFEEQSKAQEDVHCVGGQLEETPQLIEQALREFDRMVQVTDSAIYRKAVNQNKSYVEDSSLRLRFLRAKMFDVRKAVNQMMNFLRHKEIHFGEEKIAHDILPAEMNSDEISLLKSGFYEILKDRDSSGRVVVYNSMSGFGRIPDKSKLKTLLHVVYHIFFNILSAMPSVQKKGIVMILYDESKGEKTVEFPGFGFQMRVVQFFNSLPLRDSSMHMCMYAAPSSLAIYDSMLQTCLKFMQNHSITRTRLHYGSDMERQYRLRTFGISLDNFPVDTSGDACLVNPKAWCEEYLRRGSSTISESASHENVAPHTTGLELREIDVLFGRGRFIRHPGNVRFREFLSGKTEEYERLPRHQRRSACIDYSREVMSSGARFLRQTENNLWVVCDFDQVVDKVAQYYRTGRRDRLNRIRKGKSGNRFDP